MKEISIENTSRAQLIGMMLFSVPMFGFMAWFFYPFYTDQLYWMPMIICLGGWAGLIMAIWSLYALLPKRPMLETTPDGIHLGIWVRRCIPWDNVKGVRLTEIQLDGGLRKRWEAGRPYNQSLIIDLIDSGKLSFPDPFHRLVHSLTFTGKSVQLQLKLASVRNNDELFAEVVERRKAEREG